MKRFLVCFAGVMACQAPEEHAAPVVESAEWGIQDAHKNAHQKRDRIFDFAALHASSDEEPAVFSEDLLDVSAPQEVDELEEEALETEQNPSPRAGFHERNKRNGHARHPDDREHAVHYARNSPENRDCWFCGRETGFIPSPDSLHADVEQNRVFLEWNSVDDASYYTVRALQRRENRRVASHVWFAYEPIFVASFEPGFEYEFSVIAWKENRHHQNRSKQSQSLEISIPMPAKPLPEHP